MKDSENTKEPLLEVYIFETTQLIDQLETIIIQCEKNKQLNDEAINEIFRIMHTIKGSSAMMMFNNISILAHSLEDLFYFIRENKPSNMNFENLFNLVLSGVDFIKGETIKVRNGNDVNGSSDLLVTKIKNYLNEMENEHKKTCSKYSARIFYEDGCEMENVRAYGVVHNLKKISTEIYHIPEDIIENTTSVKTIRENGFLVCFSTNLPLIEVKKILEQTIFLNKLDLEKVHEYPDEIKSIFDKNKKNILSQKPQEERTTNIYKQQSIISVNVCKLDMLLNLVGELVISQAMVINNPDLENLQLDNFNKASRQLRKLTNELQDIVMSIRMVSLSMTFHNMNRLVRDMSKKLNKKVELEIIGEDTEVDKNIIDHISDPLMHLVRNSLDHGIEEKKERIENGKNEIGKITLEAKNAGSDVYIIVRDDGRGLDKEKIYNKAKKQGLVTKAKKELTDKELFSYILCPGFSTNENVTEYSGRGVGMDVVKNNIDTIGGTILIESTPGSETSIYIKIPLTLAIINGMSIAVGNSKYIIPITSIKESFKAKKEDIIADTEGNELIMIRGICYPILRLHKLFNIKTNVTVLSDGIMLTVESGSKSACIFADELIGEQQVVVKSLPNYLKKATGIAGCTILGDGNISLIIDINDLLNK